MNRDIHHMRESYGARELGDSGLPDNPLPLFSRWFAEAVEDEAIVEPNAMILSTVTKDGRPRARTVLLKERVGDEFVFYTNYQSDKARELEATSQAALTWLWLPHERQIRIEGTTERISAARSDEYFECRPRLSQLGAWASEQSSEIESRDALEARFDDTVRRFDDHQIPRPPEWGGFVVRPVRFEFWQGREGRMHDRIAYALDESGAGVTWRRSRLMP